MNKAISNLDDTIDSRDVIARIEELEEMLNEDVGLSSDECSEYWALIELRDEASDYSSDWQYGVQLIRDSYFKTYAMELAEEIGAIDSNATWPNTCIDWDKAAWELRMDYSSVEFDGATYWVR